MDDPANLDTCELWRMDDNGNRYLIVQGQRDILQEMLVKFEKSGHKQLYWIEPDELI